MITCCNEKLTCGNAKKDIYDERLFINPVVENPEEYINYDIMNGKIIPKYLDGILYEKAKYTIELLNLNNIKLAELRKRMIEAMRYLDKNDLDIYIQNKEISFISLVKYIRSEYF